MTPRRRRHQDDTPTIVFYYPHDPRGLDAPQVYDVADFNACVPAPGVEVALAAAMADFCGDWVNILEQAIEDANNNGEVGLSTRYAEQAEDWHLKRQEFEYVRAEAARIRSN